jgi:hypothetical protein
MKINDGTHPSKVRGKSEHKYSRHNPKEKQKQTINKIKNQVNTLCNEDS